MIVYLMDNAMLGDTHCQSRFANLILPGYAFMNTSPSWKERFETWCDPEEVRSPALTSFFLKFSFGMDRLHSGLL
ncbi:hypothetical protein Y032_0098g3103 [Ancylostoma ceylanicum]|nr:hypothetical protein Y032_0098g3103 [Ancylostoma ceylanicum]